MQHACRVPVHEPSGAVKALSDKAGRCQMSHVRLGLPPWCGGVRSEYQAAARKVIPSMLARASAGVR